MAKKPSSSIDNPIDVYKMKTNAVVARILDRADKQHQRDGARDQRADSKAIRDMARLFSGKKKLSSTLNKALFTQGRAMKGGPSIRMKAPDTGGTPFHFSYTTVTNAPSSRHNSASANKAKKNGNGKTSAGQQKTRGTSGHPSQSGNAHGTSPGHGPGVAVAHQRYIERDSAIKNATALDAEGLSTSKIPDYKKTEEQDLENDDSGMTPELTPEQRNKHRDKEKDEQNETSDLEDNEPVLVPDVLTRGHPYKITGKPLGRHNRSLERAEIFGDDMSFGNIGRTESHRQAFWTLYDIQNDSDNTSPDPGFKAQTIKFKKGTSLDEIKKRANELTKELANKNIPFWATIKTPETDEGIVIPHIQIINATHNVPRIQTGQSSQWAFTGLITEKQIPSPKPTMRDAQQAVQEKIDKENQPTSMGARDIQSYIENPNKVSPIHGNSASFGTIGASLSERQEFWLKLSETEAVDGRIQNRLVVELPHQANAAAHHKIIREFTKELQDRGLPFWAAIHTPTKDNDSRNFHAHIVFSDRPAKQMVDPSDGKTKWDFEVSETIVRSNRQLYTRFPHKQKKLPEMAKKDFIYSLREKYSKTVNRVMADTGNSVRYDPRSYANMGLSEKPMVSVKRTIADKMDKTRFVAMDQEWTERQIRQRLKTAALERTSTYKRLTEIERNIRSGAVAYDAIGRKRGKKDKRPPLTPDQITSKQQEQHLALERLNIERERTAEKLLNEATINALQTIIEATRTKRGNGKNVKIEDKDVDPKDLERLHNAAQEELRETLDRIQKKERSRSRIEHERMEQSRRWYERRKNDPTPAETDLKRPEPEQSNNNQKTSENSHQENIPKHRRQYTPLPKDMLDRMNKLAESYINSPLSPETFEDMMIATAKTKAFQQSPATQPEIVTSGLEAHRSATSHEKEQSGEYNRSNQRKANSGSTGDDTANSENKNKNEKNHENNTGNSQEDKKNRNEKPQTDEEKRRKRRKEIMRRKKRGMDL